MNSKANHKSTAIALGAALVSGLAISTPALADANPFAMSELPAGYRLADASGAEAKCGGNKPEPEAKCGSDNAAVQVEEKGAEAKCGEAKCGSEK